MTNAEALTPREERYGLWQMRGALYSVLERLDYYRSRETPNTHRGWVELREWLEARTITLTDMLEHHKRLGFIPEDRVRREDDQGKVAHILECIERDPRLRRSIAEYMATCSDIAEAERRACALVAQCRLSPDTPAVEDPPT